MRFVVYLVAVLAAAGIVYFVSNDSVNPESEVAVQVGSTPDATASSTETQLISLKVPGMHCPFACYPSVKKTLEGHTGVELVELAPQKEEGVIDNPVVIIKAANDFDVDSAIQTLAQTGFEDSTIVQ